MVWQVTGGQQQYGGEGRDGAQQAEEGGPQGRPHGLPPLSDVRDVQDTGRSPLCLQKHLHEQFVDRWTAFKSTVGFRGLQK